MEIYTARSDLSGGARIVVRAIGVLGVVLLLIGLAQLVLLVVPGGIAWEIRHESCGASFTGQPGHRCSPHELRTVGLIVGPALALIGALLARLLLRRGL